MNYWDKINDEDIVFDKNRPQSLAPGLRHYSRLFILLLSFKSLNSTTRPRPCPAAIEPRIHGRPLTQLAERCHSVRLER